MRRVSIRGWLPAIVAIALVLSACKAGGGPAQPPVLPAAGLEAGRAPIRQVFRPIDKIKHVVIIVQENRSFNNLFYGYPGAKTVTYGYDSKNHKIVLEPIGLATKWDIEHNAAGFYAACNGTGKIPGTDCQMNGFEKETKTCGKGYPLRCPTEYPQYSYVPQSETAPYFAMAKQYVLADEMYASNFDTSSYVSHQYIIAAQAGSTVNYPKTNWGCPGGSNDTIYTIEKSRHARMARKYRSVSITRPSATSSTPKDCRGPSTRPT